MVKVPINVRHNPNSLPYPVTPTSMAPERDSRASAVEVPNHPDSKHHIPAALQIGQSSANAWANDGQTSPEVKASDLTPRSSIESQRSHNNPYLQSSNPYFRTKHDNSDTSPLAATGNQNSTAVWADQSEKIPTNPSIARDPSSISNTQAIDLKQPPPTDPWADLSVPQEEAAFSSATDNRYDDYHTREPVGLGNQTGPIEHTHPIPVSSVSYADELRELVAQPFQNPGEELPNPNNDSKPLPSPPTTMPERHLAEVESQQARLKQQRNQTYQIRHVNWYDASSAINPRRSPIMVQNANGPCPLLALVNALVLSTPGHISTGLVETLRVREQVSLGLLLDAVIDELMSGRRGDAGQSLPDVSDLYAFLINLHTGMNVNPRFVEPVVAPTSLLDMSNDEAPSGFSGSRKAGGFEDTPFMRLYSTFAISLIHGWLPRRNHPVCAALSRCATTYEDAQSLLFAEEDLESKLESQGLGFEEQRLLEDIASVKHFLTTSPTQLTDYGLDTITETLRPGAIAILFRNDHFSTLYKQPRSGRIFTLVTDMGYAGHDEVVWESLVDISGEGSEFFSGDFRPVGNNVASNRRSAGSRSATNEAGWTTVSKSGGRSRQQSSPTNDQRAPITNAFSQLSITDEKDTVTPATTMQEDHDLALAMRLQEEEEDLERQEAAARRRHEDELSEAFINSSRSDGRNGRPPVPPRGGGGKRGPPKKQTGLDDAPPPTYEQAASGPAYQPPPVNNQSYGQVPSRANVDMSAAQASRPVRQTSAYSQTNAAHIYANRSGPATRRQQAPKKEDKDCVVM